jgi:hypothetical protein
MTALTLRYSAITRAVPVNSARPTTAPPPSTFPVAYTVLDLAELGFDGVEPAATGRPSYHPSVFLKLYIYGYLNRVQSSRRLEREAGRNVDAPVEL